jgi:DNA-binding LytR/AlgR family response regulator
MNIAIYEDDREFAGRLEMLISQYTHFPTVSNTADAAELWEQTDKAAGPVLYFLDIVLADTTLGFEAARRIVERDNGSLIVFLTAYPQKILSNSFFKIKAFNVILKSSPALGDEIKETISLAEQVLQAKCLYIHEDKFQTLYIPYDSICYIEAVKDTKRLCIHCLGGQYLIRGTLKNLHDLLAPSGFVRCHKSILVNKANIRKIDKTSMTITFQNGASCPYSYLMKGGLDGIT